MKDQELFNFCVDDEHVRLHHIDGTQVTPYFESRIDDNTIHITLLRRPSFMADEPFHQIIFVCLAKSFELAIDTQHVILPNEARDDLSKEDLITVYEMIQFLYEEYNQ